MAQGLGLTEALHGYQEGLAWSREQERLKLEDEYRQDKLDAAQAGRAVIEQARTEHEAKESERLKAFTSAQPAGGTAKFEATPFQVDDHTMFRAAAASNDHLLSRGRFDDYAKGRAALVPMQMRARQEAYERFQTDGDVGALGKSMYDTIPNGRHVVSYDTVGGTGPSTGISAGADVPEAPKAWSPDAGISATAPAPAQKPAPKSAKGKIRFVLDDGSVKFYDPAKVVSTAQRAAMNPEKVAELEYAKDLYEAQQRIHGEQDRATEGVRQKGRMELAAVNNETRLDVADTNADSRETVARIRPRGAGSGAGGGKGSAVQRTYPDADGFMVATFRDGTSKRLLIDGKPVRSGDWAKRVDKLAKDLGEGRGGYSKSPTDLRQAAMDTLASGESAAPAPAPAASGGQKDYSNLWSH